MAEDTVAINFDNDILSSPSGEVTVSGNVIVDYENMIVTASNLTVSGDQTRDFAVFNGKGDYNGPTAGGYSFGFNSGDGHAFVISYPSSNTIPSSVRTAYFSGIYYSSSDTPVTSSEACFCTGTLIRTTCGDVPVQDLKAGDWAVTSSGMSRIIRWIGHRTIDCAERGRSANWPVRILAGAFGLSLPARDLFMSPGHPVLVGANAGCRSGHLVPIMCLINGTTIERVPVDTITYWHVELDAHDILLAENLPAESYLDWGDRAFFTENSDHALANPDFVAPGITGRCRPVALDGPVVEAERRRLDRVFATRLASAAAWPVTDDALAV